MRFSKQRDEILRLLKSGCLNHPTAQQVHDEVRKVLPEVSLGTVYRNLHQLVEAGELCEVAVGGAVHYDVLMEDHHHLICSRCGALIDLRLQPELLEGLREEAARQGHAAGDCDIHVKGVCARCSSQSHSTP